MRYKHVVISWHFKTFGICSETSLMQLIVFLIYMYKGSFYEGALEYLVTILLLYQFHKTLKQFHNGTLKADHDKKSLVTNAIEKYIHIVKNTVFDVLFRLGQRSNL